MLDLSQLSRQQKLELYARACAKVKRERTHNKLVSVDLYDYEPLDFITNVLNQCNEDSWRSWRIVLKAAYGKELTEDELVLFRRVAQRDPPGKRVRELWCIVGRRGGKDSIASIIAVEAARHADNVALRPGEKAVVACLASDRDQAGIVFSYIRGYFDTIPALKPWIEGDLPSTHQGKPITLINSVEIRVSTNNYRAPRGRAYACVIFDEVAFWKDENSATPDIETYRALRPGMTVPNAMLIGISTAYRKKGLLYQKYQEHFGKDDPDVLVIQADTRTFNPNIDILVPGEIDKALAEDREYALAEYFSQFREDIQDYISREIVERCVTPERIELWPDRQIEYVAFVDPSGGSVDSFTLCIGHREVGDRAVIDAVRENRPPFSPENVVMEYCALLKQYGVRTVKGDRYAGEWPRERFRLQGINYEVAESTKSEYYLDFLPLLNAVRVELLDQPRVIGQICALERRTSPGGREIITKPRVTGSQDSISRAPGAHDDLANVVAACAVECVQGPAPLMITDEALDRARQMSRR